MQRASPFSYRCGCCGSCCRDKVITLSPYDVMRIAGAAGLSTGEVIARYTLRRGSLLRFRRDGACAALSGGLCAIHAGRPLPCRLYPLGMERAADGDRFIQLEAASGSAGVFGKDGTVDDFLDHQEVGPYLEAVEQYAGLIGRFRARIRELVDLEKTEPAEFRRVAIREALAESDYSYNGLIEALFDSDAITSPCGDPTRSVSRHVIELSRLIELETDSIAVAAAATLLAVSLGYTPAIVFEGMRTCLRTANRARPNRIRSSTGW